MSDLFSHIHWQALKASVDACRQYATKKRQIGEDELQPTLSPGEAPLSHKVWEYWKQGTIGPEKRPDIEDGDEWEDKDGSNGSLNVNGKGKEAGTDSK